MIVFKKLSLVLIMLISVLLGSCSPISSPANTITPTMAVVSTTTNIPTEVSTPTNNPDFTNLTTNCVEILNTPPIDVKLSGLLALSSPSSGSYILNLETNEKTYLKGDSLGELIVSPDMQKIAYIDYDTSKLIIYNTSDKKSITFHDFNGRFRLANWLDNKNLVINKAKEDKPDYYHYSLVIFDSQTSNIKEFNMGDFPNADIYSNGYLYLFPNPQITKMVYLAGDVEKSVVLFDTQSEVQLREIYFIDSAPLWTRDGEEFAISAVLKFDKYSNFADNLPYLGGDEIFLANAIGEIRRLTFLATRYPNNYITSLSWSPTKEYIAFNLQNSTQPDFGLSILNINTGEIVNYCIQDNWDHIYWSPDRKQIAFTRWGSLGSSQAKVYILDLEKNRVFKIADNATVAGWMINK